MSDKSKRLPVRPQTVEERTWLICNEPDKKEYLGFRHFYRTSLWWERGTEIKAKHAWDNLSADEKEPWIAKAMDEMARYLMLSPAEQRMANNAELRASLDRGQA